MKVSLLPTRLCLLTSLLAACEAKNEPCEDSPCTCTDDSCTDGDPATRNDGGVSTKPDLDSAIAEMDASVEPDDIIEFDAGPGICEAPDQVDLLFVIDNSRSMREEQANLAVALPRLVSALTTGDFDGDGDTEFPAVKSLHIGVISSDMGAVGVSGIQACSGRGDDGTLQNSPNADVVGCSRAFPPYLSFELGAGEPQQTGADFACLAQLGTNGCGFEQQLEATYKALAPATETSFYMGSPGHGQDNGFMRSTAILAIVLVSDEDDCSLPESSRELLDARSIGYKSEGLNMRCYLHGEDGKLHAPHRFINGIRASRTDAENIVFAAIAGVPADLSDAQLQDFTGVLEDPRMKIAADGNVTANETMPVPACETSNGKAYPARRIVQTAAGFGDNGLVRSICQSDFTPALMPVLRKIAIRLDNCNPSPVLL